MLLERAVFFHICKANFYQLCIIAKPELNHQTGLRFIKLCTFCFPSLVRKIRMFTITVNTIWLLFSCVMSRLGIGVRDRKKEEKKPKHIPLGFGSAEVLPEGWK